MGSSNPSFLKPCEWVRVCIHCSPLNVQHHLWRAGGRQAAFHPYLLDSGEQCLKTDKFPLRKNKNSWPCTSALKIQPLVAQGLSHRNLLGDDMTDCSFIFLYILCTMSIRFETFNGKLVSRIFFQAEHPESAGLCPFKISQQAGRIDVEPRPQQIQVELN